MAKIIDTRTDPETGHTINVYESGAEYDVNSGELVKAPPQYAITRENARAMQQLSTESRRRAANEAADEAAEEAIAAGKISAPAGIDHLGLRSFVKKSSQLIFNATSGRSIEAPLSFVGKAAGWFQEDNKPSVAVQINTGLTAEQARFMLKLLSDVQRIQQEQGLRGDQPKPGKSIVQQIVDGAFEPKEGQG